MSLPGFKTLLFGAPGDGKTHVLRTLMQCGITPIVQFTEPGMRALHRCATPSCSICYEGGRPRDLPAIPYNYIPMSGGDLDTLKYQVEMVNTRDQKFLCNINDTSRSKNYTQYTDIVKNLYDFKDSTGKSWGPVGSWGTDRAYVLDGLSETATMAMDCFVGRRPLYDKSDYQVAQRIIFNTLKLLVGYRCHVIVIGHLDAGEDATGRPTSTVLSVGRKLSPELPRIFDDMPFAYREVDKFYWSTARFGLTSKGRNLPYRDKMDPTFKAIYGSWASAGGKIEPTTQEIKP